MGRPSKYTDDMPERVLELMAVGASLTEVADDLGISRATLSKWTDDPTKADIAYIIRSVVPKKTEPLKGRYTYSKGRYNGSEYIKQRRAMDPRFRLSMNTRALVRGRLATKTKGTFDGLGYSVDELMTHIGAMFTDGMSWDNYGEWHIDHIIPDSAFRYQSMDDEEFKQCWGLSNLQPLWAAQNMRKGNRVS